MKQKPKKPSMSELAAKVKAHRAKMEMVNTSHDQGGELITANKSSVKGDGPHISIGRSESNHDAFDDQSCKSNALDQQDVFNNEKEIEATTHRPKVTTSAMSTQRMPYPVHAFGTLDAVIMLIAKAVQVDREMVGSSLLGVISALAQCLINVSPRQSGAGCPVTLNMFVIASSGERKSSTIDTIVKPVYAAISRVNDERRSMIIQDVTVDGMVVGLISRCPAQFLLALEGASLLGGHAMSRDNLSRFLGNVASLFSGEPLTRTRVEEHHYAQGRRLSVLLFSQPIVAMDFLSSDLVMQQGMGNRFLYSQPPSLLGTRKHVDIELDAEPLYQEFCAKITALASHAWKIDPATGGMDTRTVRMSPGAKAAWVEFYNKLEMAAGPGGDLATHAGYVTLRCTVNSGHPCFKQSVPFC